MPEYKIVFARSARKELQALSIDVAERTLEKIKLLAPNPRLSNALKSWDNFYMPKSTFKKRKNQAGSHMGTKANRKPDPMESAGKTGENHSTSDSPGPVDNQTGSTGEPVPESRIKASDLFTFRKRTLSAEARELLAKIDAGGIPLVITENLERIAKAHGIEVSYEMTPNDIIARLRKLA
jgi:hypothetical protein